MSNGILETAGHEVVDVDGSVVLRRGVSLSHFSFELPIRCLQKQPLTAI
jgi:hypothetical protein